MDFWKKGNRPTGSLFAKKGEQAADKPPSNPTSSSMQPAAKPETKPARNSAIGSSSTMASLSVSSSSHTPSPRSGLSAAAVKFDHDLACGVFVGAFDIPGMIVSVEVVESTNATTQKVERIQDWLRTNDMLAILTREYGKAKLKLSNIAIRPDTPPQTRLQLSKDREEATQRLNDIREQVVCLLHSRRAYHRAKEAGVTILIEV